MEGLVAQGLVKWFKSRKVVDNVSLDIQRGEVVGLLGPNGAGKTTSFYMMVGLLPTDGGRIFLEGAEISRLPMYQRCRMGIGYLPQESSVFRKLTVEENLLAILETLELSSGERRQRARELLAELDLTALAPYPAYTLSGGERRRLEITRALVTAPQYLLLDEPFTGIDPIAIGDIQEIVGRLRERGIGILVTDHNVRETLAITDRAYILYDGRILVSGTAAEIVNNPVAREIYLGDRLPSRRGGVPGDGHRSAPLPPAEPAARHDPAARAGDPTPPALHARASGRRAERAPREPAAGRGAGGRRRDPGWRRGRAERRGDAGADRGADHHRSAPDRRTADRRPAVRPDRRAVRRTGGALPRRTGGARGRPVRELRPVGLVARRSPRGAAPLRHGGSSGPADRRRDHRQPRRGRVSPGGARGDRPAVRRDARGGRARPDRGGPEVRPDRRRSAHDSGVPPAPAPVEPARRSGVRRDHRAVL